MRQGTRALLSASPNIEIVAETGQGEEVLALAQHLGPDVVILDIRLQGLSGVEVARALRQDLPEIKVLIVSAYDYEQYVRALFAIGVHGYLIKNASGPELISAIHAVCRGETVLSAEVSSQIASRPHRGGIAARMLSDREREVLAFVAQGASNKDIANRLSIGVRTVETHVSNAMAKLGAQSRTEAINLAIQRGIIVWET
jgi:DNA-binding NarL/FixJ family response regulator